MTPVLTIFEPCLWYFWECPAFQRQDNLRYEMKTVLRAVC